VVTGMTHYPQINAFHRPTRIQLSATEAQLKLSSGHLTKAKLHVVSVNGGLLQLAKALAEGDFIEVVFETHSGKVRGVAEILEPVRRGPGTVIQPFRFVALDDDDHRVLQALIESSNHRSFLGISSNWATKF
jgi:hypothetical protein